MKGRKRYIRLIALLAALTLLAVACGGDDEPEGGDTGAATGATGEAFTPRVEIPTTDQMVDTAEFKTDAPWTIGYADASLSNSARVFIWQFAQWAESEYPQIEEIVRTDANDSPDKQTSDIQDLVARDVDCLIVAATSQDAINPAIEQATAAGIPVIIQERDVTTDEYVTWVNINTRDIGVFQAEAAAEQLGGKGNVVLLEGLAGNGAAEEARKGHEEVLAGFPDIKVLATEYSSWSREDGKTIMENWLQAFPQIDAVIADSGIQQQGAYEAAVAAGRADEIKVWTGDSLQGWIRQVSDESIPGALVNRPLRFGALAVDACAAILAGVPVPHIWLDPVETLDMTDLSQYIAPDTEGSDEWWDWWDMPEEWLPA